MRKSIVILLAAIGTFLAAACNDYETYGDKKEKERKSISQFIRDSAITVITESQFIDQGYSTNLERREFVYLDKSGVYMQIVRRGCGSPIENGENVNLLCRFVEINIQDSTGMSNAYIYPYNVDKMNVRRSGSTFSASFIEGLMYDSYGASVPSGWLVPLLYINVGRPTQPDEDISKVRLIVPHSQGTTQNAKAYVYPYYYEITYERER